MPLKPVVKPPPKPQELVEDLVSGKRTLAEISGMTPRVQYAIAQLGYQMLQVGQYDRAESIYRGLVALTPRDSTFRSHLAATLYVKGLLEESLIHYNEALRLQPRNVEALAGRGELLVRLKEVPQGLLDLRSALQFDPATKYATTQRARSILSAIQAVAAKAPSTKKAKRK